MRTPWQIQQAVIKALLIRELKTRFGSSPLGYAWAIIGPFLQILIMVVIFSAINRTGYQGLPYPLFFAPAILLLNFLTSMMTSGAATIKANKGLFNYKQVKPFDVESFSYYPKEFMNINLKTCPIIIFEVPLNLVLRPY